MPTRSTLFQDPLLDYYGLDPEDDPADLRTYTPALFDSYDDPDEEESLEYAYA